MADSSSEQQLSQTCYHEWMALQQKQLEELQALVQESTNNSINSKNDTDLKEIAEKITKAFQEYIQKRSHLSQGRGCTYFAPSWNTSLENSLLWAAGCRPSSFIRLLYALCGSHTECKLSQFLPSAGNDNHNRSWLVGRGGSTADLSSDQFTRVNDLHMKTIQEEDNITSRLAILQEDTADLPIAIIAYGSARVGETDVAVERALDEHEAAMANIMQEADNLRLTTLKKLLEILTPSQAVEFLVAGMKLHLCMHEWGKMRDRKQGFIGREEGTSSEPAGGIEGPSLLI